MTETTIDPNEAFTGTWELWEEGRMPLAAGSTYTLGSVGGEAEHTLTVDEMPSHTHTSHGGWSAGSLGNTYWRTDSNSPANLWTSDDSTGGDQPHNNLPPYKAIYIWERIL